MTMPRLLYPALCLWLSGATAFSSFLHPARRPTAIVPSSTWLCFEWACRYCMGTKELVLLWWIWGLADLDWIYPWGTYWQGTHILFVCFLIWPTTKTFLSLSRVQDDSSASLFDRRRRRSCLWVGCHSTISSLQDDGQALQISSLHRPIQSSPCVCVWHGVASPSASPRSS
jgi:hypothetical protein